jgi:hypothetical protein
LIGPLLIFLGYYRGEVHPAWFTLLFTIGTLVTLYHFYRWYYNPNRIVKDIY